MNPSGDPSRKLAEARRRLTELEAVEAERARAAQVQDALYRIAELASSARDLREFYRAIHAVVGELIDARNFYLALYDQDRRLINWPYCVDQVDADIPDPNRWEPFGSGYARGGTAYVLRTGQPQHLQRAEHRVFRRQHRERRGAPGASRSASRTDTWPSSGSSSSGTVPTRRSGATTTADSATTTAKTISAHPGAALASATLASAGPVRRVRLSTQRSPRWRR